MSVTMTMELARKTMKSLYNEEDKKEFMSAIEKIAKDGLDNYKISGVTRQLIWYGKYQNLLPQIQLLALAFVD